MNSTSSPVKAPVHSVPPPQPINVVASSSVPPGFSPLFSGLRPEEHQMAIQYVSHSDATKRQARILRVEQSLDPSFAEQSTRMPQTTHNLLKGKGHSRIKRLREKSLQSYLLPPLFLKRWRKTNPSKSSYQEVSSSSSPIAATGSRMGYSSESFLAGARDDGKKPRWRPNKWKRNKSQDGKHQENGVETSARDAITACVINPKRNAEMNVGRYRGGYKIWLDDCLTDETCPLIDRISRCRKELAKKKKTGNLSHDLSDLIDGPTARWNIMRLRQAFSHQDVERILLINPDLTRQDKLIWGFTKDGQYIAQSGYRLLENILDQQHHHQSTLTTIEEQLWSNLWKIQAPPKLKHYQELWRTCKACQLHTESICHVLFGCSIVKATWEISNFPLPPQADGWLRCNGVSMSETYNSAPTISKWEKPPSGMLKYNFDASWILPNRNCGVAWLVRDHIGEILLHSRYAYSAIPTTCEAEILSSRVASHHETEKYHSRIFIGATKRSHAIPFYLFPQFHEIIDQIYHHLHSLELHR
ncbi:unnamed protein product [Thlaspi arvense]|uniref:Reverse transcriptase zinc-binding domain-containing protein n=1 Tax=Thlaspi arvense TaxID=13288 RepID=A0AAU9RPR9_THLAR|nr:unnamed protein product [Thlaspi arvense]